MERYHRVAQNSTSGLPIASPTISVYHAGTVVAATIYSDEGATGKANPFTGDTLGRFDFYAPDGDYDILVAGAGVTSYTIPDVTLGDPKRAQGISESETAVMANALYRRSGTPGYDRRNTALAAWLVELDADSAQDYLRVLRAASGANPITWTELLRIVAGGQMAPGLGSLAAPSYSFLGDLNTGVYSPGADEVGLVAGGVAVLRALAVASAVNYLRIRPSIATSPVLVDPQGTDANIGLDLLTKGTGVLRLFTNALERVRVNAAFSLLLRQASFDYTLQWNDPAAARTLTIPDPGGADDFVFKAMSQVLSGKAGVPFQWAGGAPGLNTAVGTNYLPPNGYVTAGPDANEDARDEIVDGAGEITRFRTNLATAPGTTATRTFTVRKNAVDTGLTVTYASGESGEKVVTSTVTVAAGDKISIASTVGTAAAADSRARWALRLRETVV